MSSQEFSWFVHMILQFFFLRKKNKGCPILPHVSGPYYSTGQSCWNSCYYRSWYYDYIYPRPRRRPRRQSNRLSSLSLSTSLPLSAVVYTTNRPHSKTPDFKNNAVVNTCCFPSTQFSANTIVVPLTLPSARNGQCVSGKKVS